MNRPLRWIGLSGLLLVSGCALLGVAATAVTREGGFKARYSGLKGQKVAVITWVDRATEFNYPMMGTDVRRAVSAMVIRKLQDQANADELKDTTYVEVRHSHLWQKNYPHLLTRSLPEFAPKVAADLGATRVVYVELTQFMTRDPQAPILLRGSATMNIRVAEVTAGKARLAYDEIGVAAGFPHKASEGIAASESVTEEYVFKGLIDQVGWQAASRFFSFEGQ